MMTVTYINHNGASIVLNSGNYYVSANDLRNFAWEYTASTRPSGFGGRVTFSRPVQEKTITIGIKGSTPNEFNANATALMALTEPDIINHVPGKLYLGNQYLTCYLAVASSVSTYSRRGNFVVKELKIVVTEPYWCTEETFSFYTLETAPDPTGKKYDLRYPYRYGTDYGAANLYNDHYAPCPAVLTFYGPCASPSVTIAGNTYNVMASAPATTNIIVDQLLYRIYTRNSSGYEFNIFDSRNKAHDIFRPIPPGPSTILFAGSFNFDIRLIKQRSEPLWI
jgi:hypothetical protein